MREPLKFSGIMPANILPFKADLSIDEPAYRKHIKWLADTPGVTGIVANGHAAEVASLSREERKRTLAVALNEVAGACPIVAGVYTDGTAEAGRDALLLHHVAHGHVPARRRRRDLRDGQRHRGSTIRAVRGLPEGRPRRGAAHQRPARPARPRVLRAALRRHAQPDEGSPRAAGPYPGCVRAAAAHARARRRARGDPPRPGR